MQLNVCFDCVPSTSDSALGQLKASFSKKSGKLLVVKKSAVPCNCRNCPNTPLDETIYFGGTTPTSFAYLSQAAIRVFSSLGICLERSLASPGSFFRLWSRHSPVPYGLGTNTALRSPRRMGFRGKDVEIRVRLLLCYMS